MTTQFQHALCKVTGEACASLAREPCPTLRTSKVTAQGVSVASVRLGHDVVLFIERHSDGTYAISLVEGKQGGVGVEEGASRGAGSADAQLAGELGYHVGRTYTAATPGEARALVDRLRHQRSVAVSTLVAGAADLAGLEQADPEVSSYVLAGTGAVDALVKFGLSDYLDGGLEGHAASEVGVRIAAHERAITAYVRLDTRAGVFFDALHNLSLPIERTRDGHTATGKASVVNPLGIHKEASRVVGGSLALHFGPGSTLREVEVVGYSGTNKAQREIHARLDPHDPAVAAALNGLRHNLADPSAYASLGRAAASSAALDIRSFRTTDSQSQHQHGGSIGLDGFEFGAHYGSRSKVNELLSEDSRPVGGVWERRIDCVA